MKVLFFGSLREAAGVPELECAPPADVATLADLRDWLSARDPALGAAVRARGVRVVRDRAFAPFDTPIAGAREIAFVSPLSGG
jgi:molybdopterin synthase sulfur carrier subunit